MGDCLKLKCTCEIETSTRTPSKINKYKACTKLKPEFVLHDIFPRDYVVLKALWVSTRLINCHLQKSIDVLPTKSANERMCIYTLFYLHSLASVLFSISTLADYFFLFHFLSTFTIISMFLFIFNIFLSLFLLASPSRMQSDVHNACVQADYLALTGGA